MIYENDIIPDNISIESLNVKKKKLKKKNFIQLKEIVTL